MQSKGLGKYSLHLLRAKKGSTKTKLGEDVRLERHLEGNTQVNINGLCESKLLAFHQFPIPQLKSIRTSKFFQTHFNDFTEKDQLDRCKESTVTL